MNWDGPEAVEPIEAPVVIAKSEEPAEVEVVDMNESESIGSEDEYLSESAQAPGRRGNKVSDKFFDARNAYLMRIAAAETSTSYGVVRRKR